MGINFVTRSESYSVASCVTYDLPAISFQAGDLLIFGTVYSAGSYIGLSSVVDVGAGSYPFTLDGFDGQGTGSQLELGHILSAPSSGSSVVFRATWPSTNTGIAGIFVEVWRPTAGVVMQIDVAKTGKIGSSATPTTPAINTSANSLVFALFAGGALYQKTVPLIAGASADMNPAAPAQAYHIVRIAQSLSASQTGIVAQYTLASSRSWYSQVMAFKEIVTSVNQTITCTGITLGGTSTTQEVFVGGIG